MRSSSRTAKKSRSSQTGFWTRKRVNLLALLVLLGVFVLVIGAVWSEVDAYRHYYRAQDALDRADFARAKEHLAPCLKAWSSNAEIHFLMARALRRNGELREAEEEYALAQHLGWSEEAIDFDRRLLAIQRGRNPRADEAFFGEALKNDHPDSDLILEVLAPAYFRIFELGLALGATERWTKLQPWREDAWELKARIHVRLVEMKDAADAYRQVIEINPENTAAQLGLGECLLELNQPTEALIHFQQASQAHPRSAEVRFGLARCYRLLNQLEQAAELLDGLLAEMPTNSEILAERGRLAREQNQPEQAESFLRQAVDHPPYEPNVLLDFAVVLQSNNKSEEAEKIRAKYRQAEADLKEMRDTTREIIETPNDPELRFKAGQLMLRNHHEQEGIRWLQSALAVDPGHRETHRLLAEYYQDKDPGRAQQHRLLAEANPPKE